MHIPPPCIAAGQLHLREVIVMENNLSKLKRWLLWLFLLLIVVGSIPLLVAWRQGHFKSVESLRCYVASFGLLGPLVLTAIQALQVILPVLPGFFGCVAGTVLFGVHAGFWCNYIGICAGSIISFYLARHFGVALVEQLVPIQKYDRFVAWMDRRKSYTVALFLCILLPLAPDDFLCYFSGLIKMSPKTFNLIILAAKPWCILAYCLLSGYFLL